MTDPYKALGVSPDASDAEVKKAYRELARKYHPDSYAGNPLSDLAAEKMKEINEAYDQVMAMRRGGAGAAEAPSGGGSQFSDIRRLINMNRVTQAEELLDGVPPQSRDAEWYFLKGTIQHTRGWLDDAFENISRACSMNPNNAEYRAALNQLQWQRQTGRPRPGQGVNMGQGMNPGCLGGCSMCDICTTLYCADCCCECMGGDFIRCC